MEEAIKVEVAEPETKGAGPQRFVVYKVRGEDRFGEFSASRRYSEFFDLRTMLLNRWPGLLVPSLPPKRTIGSMEQDFIEQRRKELDQFMKRLAGLRYFWGSEEMQLFLRSKDEKCLERLPKQPYFTVIEKYQKNFASLQNTQVRAEMKEEVASFAADLKAVVPQLAAIIAKAEGVEANRKRCLAQELIAVGTLLPQYEANSLKEHVCNEVDRLVIGVPSKLPSLSESEERLKLLLSNNQVGMLLALLQREQREVQSFFQSVAVKGQFESSLDKLKERQRTLQADLQNITAGKSSLTAKIRNLSKEEELAINQREAKAVADQLEQLSFICDISTALLCKTEIVRFKEQRRVDYRTSLRALLEWEQTLAESKLGFWRAVLGSDSLRAEK